MQLLTKELREKLIENGRATRDAQANGADEPAHMPVVKFFFGGAMTWLISELDEDGDTMFGLCDLGQGFPELGNVALSQIASMKGRFGGAERDLHFRPKATIERYGNIARAAGRIVEDF